MDRLPNISFAAIYVQGTPNGSNDSIILLSMKAAYKFTVLEM